MSTLPLLMKVSRKLRKPPSIFAEMHVEDLLARSEIADHVKDLLATLLELLGPSPLAEVQAVVRAFPDRHELLGSVGRSQDGIDPAPARAPGHSRILAVTGQPDRVFLGDRNDALEEVGDALPIGVGVDSTRDRRRRILFCPSVDELAVTRPPRPAAVSDRGMPMIVKLYLTAGMPARAQLRMI